MDNRLKLLQRISFEDLKNSIKMSDSTDHSLQTDKIDILDNKSMNSSEQSLQSIPIQSFGADDDLKVVMFELIDHLFNIGLKKLFLIPSVQKVKSLDNNQSIQSIRLNPNCLRAPDH